MDQFVIKTGSKVKSMQFLSYSNFLSTHYFYTEKAHIYDSIKDVNAALAWAKKDTAANIKSLKADVKRYAKEVAKGNLSLNKVMLDNAKDDLKTYEGLKFKVVKL